MPLTDILKDVEADVAVLAKLPGDIRDKVKAGVADLTAIRDEIDATIKTLTTDGRAHLAALKASAEAVAPKV